MTTGTPADAPTTARPPFERHSVNSNRDRDGRGSPMSVVKSPPARGTAPRGGGACADENRGHDCDAGASGRDPARPSAPGRSPIVSATPDRAARGAEEGGDDGENRTAAMDASFPDNWEDVEIGGPGEEAEGGEGEDDEDEEPGAEETEQDRTRREMAESEALARQLMAEEAMASYALGTEYLRENANQFSSEDFAALQAALAEEDPEAEDQPSGEGLINPNDVLLGDSGSADDSRELSYDALLRLGERIGDVKEERWARIAQAEIARHCGPASTFAFEPRMAAGKEENHTEVKCQVCQFPYEGGELLRRLPCGHCFHRECIDAWLGAKDTCALCRKSIVPADVEGQI